MEGMKVLLSVIIWAATDAPTRTIVDEKHLLISLVPELIITECTVKLSLAALRF